MRRWLTLAIAAFSLATTALAEDAPTKRLDTAQQGRGWEAVGRLDVGGAGFCTGALIAPNLVLTAAHCLFDPTSGQRIDPRAIEFLAGWRNGRASAYRTVRRAVVHPDYDFTGEVSSVRVRNDIALLELTREIRNGSIEPFGIEKRPKTGDRVGVVSYVRSYDAAPSLQEVCDVLGQQDGVLVTSCTVDFGASGAPILTFKNGKAYIVSVISAKAQADGRRVSLGTSLLEPLSMLQAELATGGGFGDEPFGTERRLAAGQRSGSGPKFVKP